MKIVYLGYDVLLCCLEAVCASGHEVLKIYTVPPGGDYDKSDSVRAFGARRGIPVTDRPFGPADVEEMHRCGCELLICAGYPYKVPVDPRLPAVNLHPALLPVGRGAWPLPVTILRGLRRSGVTLHKLSERFDAGDMIAQESFPVAPDETLLTLTEKVRGCSVRLLARFLRDAARQYRQATAQGPAAEYWPDPSPDEQTLSLQMDGETLDRTVRAFAGFGCLLETPQGRVSMDMPVFRALRLSDRAQVQAICAANGNTLSAYAFATPFCWQETLRLKIYLEPDWFVIRMGESDYYFPCGYFQRTEVFLRRLLHRGRPFRLGYITPAQKQSLERAYPELRFSATRQDFDYIVPVKQIALLAGGHFQTIRKEIHQFARSADLRVEEITAKNLGDVERLSSQWNAQAPGQGHGTDAQAERRAIAHYEQLGMQGILARKNGAAFGFVMGSRCGPGMIDVHFAKCLDKSPGADFFIKQQFCAGLLGEYEEMNLEDDMGLAGLRTRKLLYRPTSLTEVFMAEYKGGRTEHGGKN